MKHDLEWYLAVPHLLAVESVERPNGEWVRRAEYPELPDCYAEAFSAVDAMEEAARRRVDCIRHLLGQFPYTEIHKTPIVLPERERHEDYSRQAVPPEMLVPEVY